MVVETAFTLFTVAASAISLLIYSTTHSKTCQIINDTSYKVKIVEHDQGSNLLYPDQQANTTCTELEQSPYRPDLTLYFPYGEEAKIKFFSASTPGNSSSQHNVSQLFRKQIEDYEKKRKIIEKSTTELTVTRVYSEWSLIFTHPGKYKMKQKVEMSRKASWSKADENEIGFEAAVGAGIIRAIEASAKFRSSTRITNIHQKEESVTQTREFEFDLKPCYIWREVVVVETNIKSPFDRLEIPTIHIFATDDGKEPEKDQFIFIK